ncbi:methylmalonyl-CoA mutase [Aeromicrobium sp. PE09-221]|uniref:methylmalonyl-CoA mutase subunit beta n=1 Tax=Aeromicrobium sp. PE09-221 TaxID=1898043 RepID=UPI000B3E4AD5|nr:methylmalonyl-CoA mutase subunit beta [Aeromicrobium sp. PE09-221]OUZ07823.1 methylmalonyl-CoA mutase [Aeromicrobium sp. PE09-221]
MAPDSTIRLAEGVHHDLAEWEKATAAVLRKKGMLAEEAPDSDVWDLLATRTLDGISVTPLGTPALTDDLPDAGLPGQSPFTRGATAARTELDGWDVRGWFIDPDTDAEQVSAELENGANSLWLTVGPEGIDVDRLPALLQPVFLDLAPVVLDAPTDPRGAAAALLEVVEDKAVQAHAGTNLGADPLGALVRGRGDTGLEVVIDLARLAKERGVRGALVDATAVHELGASDVQELAYALFAGVTYLRALTEAGLSANESAEQLEFRFAATDEQFATIAKFRAARRLWDRVGQLSEVTEPARAQRQHAVTSRPMMCRYDSYTNMLRTTVATFAAGVGGADAVTTLPFDEPLGLPTPFSRRIARNTSALLISESHVAAVTDPAGGSHAVEKLTDDMARAAWELFGELDATEGPEAALELLRSRIDVTVSERARSIARRKRPITGVSEFPHLTETLPDRAPYPIAPSVFRYAGEYEEMRDEPAEQPVFLATMGPIAQHTGRASFVINLLAAGGIHHGIAGATDGVDDVVSAYREAGQPAVVCLAGTDKAYAEWGAELIAALRQNGARHVIIAGKNEIGADDAAAMGVDALAFLRRTREVLAR